MKNLAFTGAYEIQWFRVFRWNNAKGGMRFAFPPYGLRAAGVFGVGACRGEPCVRLGCWANTRFAPTRSAAQELEGLFKATKLRLILYNWTVRANLSRYERQGGFLGLTYPPKTGQNIVICPYLIVEFLLFQTNIYRKRPLGKDRRHEDTKALASKDRILPEQS